MISKIKIFESAEGYQEQIEKLKNALEAADAIIVGAGSGLSTSAGFTYTGERFLKYFRDFAEKYSKLYYLMLL